MAQTTGITVKAKLPKLLRDRLNTLKPTSINTIPTVLGDVAPTYCVRLHEALVALQFGQIEGSLSL